MFVWKIWKLIKKFFLWLKFSLDRKNFVNVFLCIKFVIIVIVRGLVFYLLYFLGILCIFNIILSVVVMKIKVDFIMLIY